MYKCKALISPLDHTWQGDCNLMNVGIIIVLGLKVCLIARYSVCYMGLSGDHPSGSSWAGPSAVNNSGFGGLIQPSPLSDND